MEATKHQNFQMNISVSSSQIKSLTWPARQAEKLNTRIELGLIKSNFEDEMMLQQHPVVLITAKLQIFYCQR